MIYVGIDAASQKHDVCIINEEGKQFKKIFTIHNNDSEYKKLLDEIKAAKKFFNDRNVLIGIESTGVYSKALYNYLGNKLGEVVLINPILTSMFELTDSIHYAKTDHQDALGICNFLKRNKNNLRTFTPISYIIKNLKSLYREYTVINQSLNKEINRLKGIIHVTFPELFNVFSNFSVKKLLCLLIKYPLPSDLTKHKASVIMNDVNKDKYISISLDEVNSLKQYASKTIGTYSQFDGKSISFIAERIYLLKRQKEELLSEMKNIVINEHKEILTIPGIGIATAAGIIGEIGNITNFNNADALVCFAGLDNRVYQSGNYEAKRTRISKRGSSYLRNALLLASRTICRIDPTYKAYFQKKISQGKCYWCALIHASKKLCRLVFHILKTKQNYKPVITN